MDELIGGLTPQQIKLTICRYAGGEARCQTAHYAKGRHVWAFTELFDIGIQSHHSRIGRPDCLRLVLQPLHKMTPAHAKELVRIVLGEDYPLSVLAVDYYVDGNSDFTTIWVRDDTGNLIVAIDFVKRFLNGMVDIRYPRPEYQKPHTINAFIWQYLTMKGYAVPLFFGVGHPANGKDAVELGLAVYASE